jgi:hypothetical protein
MLSGKQEFNIYSFPCIVVKYGLHSRSMRWLETLRACLEARVMEGNEGTKILYYSIFNSKGF